MGIQDTVLAPRILQKHSGYCICLQEYCRGFQNTVGHPMYSGCPLQYPGGPCTTMDVLQYIEFPLQAPRVTWRPIQHHGASVWGIQGTAEQCSLDDRYSILEAPTVPWMPLQYTANAHCSFLEAPSTIWRPLQHNGVPAIPWILTAVARRLMYYNGCLPQ